MPFRAWVFIAAIGLSCWAVSGQAQQETQGEQGQTDTDQPPAQTYPLPFPVNIVEDEAETEARRRSEAEARQREIDDLAAQQGMNAATQAMQRATEDMRDYAFYSTVFVGIGTILLIITLWLTRSANRAAGAAVAVTRAMGEAQTRAYVHVQIAKIQGMGKGNPEVNLGKTNYGKSPARNVRIAVRRFVGNYKQAGGLGNAEYRKMVDLGPGQSFTVRYPLDIEAIRTANNAADADQMAAVVTGKIKYVDPFTEDDRTTDFAFTTWPANKISDADLDTRKSGNNST